MKWNATYFTIYSLILILFSNPIECKGQAGTELFSNLNIYFWDSISTPQKPVYRELKKIGDHSYFSKPEVLDVKLLYNRSFARGRIELLLEELQSSTELSSSGTFVLKDKSWILIKVLDSRMTDNSSSPIIIQNIAYQTAYFYNSACYDKHGFRIRAVYVPDNGGQRLQIAKEFMFHD